MATTPMADLNLVPDFEPVYLPDVVTDNRAAAVGPSPERRVELIAERDTLNGKMSGRLTYGQQTNIRSRIREINAELAGNADAKAMVTWLRARARKGLGAFDVEIVRAALQLLPPGWRVEPTVALVPINANTRAVLSYAWEGKDDYVSGVRDEWDRKGWWALPTADARADMQRLVHASRGTAGKLVVPNPEAGAIYVEAAEAGLWGDAPHAHRDDVYIHVRTPTVGVAGWKITAPWINHQGEVSFVLADKPGRHPSTPLVGDAFYKWAYAHDLAEQAAAALPAAEAAVPKAASTVAAWSRNLCQVCFQPHALTPQTNTVVDHGYTRPGSGYNEQACVGSRYYAYSESCDQTNMYGVKLTLQLRAREERLRVLRAGQHDDGKPIIFTARVPLLDAKGQRVPEENTVLQTMPGYGKWKQTTEFVTPTDGRWEPFWQSAIAENAAEAGRLRNAIPFYRAAVRLWRSGRDEDVQVVLDRITKGISDEDREGL